jgi:hypothetical protein
MKEFHKILSDMLTDLNLIIIDETHNTDKIANIDNIEMYGVYSYLNAKTDNYRLWWLALRNGKVGVAPYAGCYPYVIIIDLCDPCSLDIILKIVSEEPSIDRQTLRFRSSKDSVNVCQKTTQ